MAPKTKKAKNKTTANRSSVKQFLAKVDNPRRREDCATIVELMTELTGHQPKMWGTSIVGFGEYHYKYESGREGDMFLTGVSPRKQSLTLYIMGGFETHDALLDKLGKFKTGKACLYVNKLDDIHMPTLKKMIKASVSHMRKKYNTV